MAQGKEGTSVPKSLGKICVPQVGDTSPKQCIHFLRGSVLLSDGGKTKIWEYWLGIIVD